MEKWNDYELVSLAQEYNEEATLILHEKYQPLILKKSRKFFAYMQNKGVELSDLIQECTIGFEEAIKHFQQEEEGSFYTFANLCMDRQLMSELTRQNLKKFQFLNEAVPLETIDENHDGDLIHFLQDNRHNPEEGLMEDVDFEELTNRIVKVLTSFEECVFRLKLQDFNYREIADILDRDQKSIDNAIQRIRGKIRNIL